MGCSPPGNMTGMGMAMGAVGAAPMGAMGTDMGGMAGMPMGKELSC